MPEPTFALTADDDLPRTIRRERDAQREAREREAREREAQRESKERRPAAAAPPEPVPEFELQAPAVTVTDFEVPFAKLMMFFMRAVFAAIPALLVLMAFLWLFGQALQTFFPALLKMKILIYMP